MKTDVLAWVNGKATGGGKRPSKETLNHPGLIALVSGCDPFKQTPEAFRRAYAALGIDIINIVPEQNAPRPMEVGQVVIHDDSGTMEGYQGVFNTTSRVRFPFESVDEFWKFDCSRIEYSDLKLPGAQYMMPCCRSAIESKMRFIGDVGMYYYQLYTTLFMWGVEALGWEIFMLAVAEDPERFDRQFLTPVFEKSKAIVRMLSELDTPLVVCHDDIAVGTGPAFSPDWYAHYIFPRYEELWQIPHDRGKKVLFVADGKLDWALEPLRRGGADGVMFESPATSLDAVIDTFSDGLFIGGISTRTLAFGTVEDVRAHVREICTRTARHPGYALCSSGGLPGDLPIANAEAYFDARVEYGYTPAGWRCDAPHDNEIG